MSIWVILIEMAVFSAIFTAIVFFAAGGYCCDFHVIKGEG